MDDLEVQLFELVREECEHSLDGRSALPTSDYARKLSLNRADTNYLIKKLVAEGCLSQKKRWVGGFPRRSLRPTLRGIEKVYEYQDKTRR